MIGVSDDLGLGRWGLGRSVFGTFGVSDVQGFGRSGFRTLGVSDVRGFGRMGFWTFVVQFRFPKFSDSVFLTFGVEYQTTTSAQINIHTKPDICHKYQKLNM